MKHRAIYRSEWEVFLARARILNREILPVLLGVIGIAVSSKNPSLFGLLGGVFVVYFASRRLRRFDAIYQIWRETNHPLVTLRIAGSHLAPFCICWMFLGFVAIGAVSPP